VEKGRGGKFVKRRMGEEEKGRGEEWESGRRGEGEKNRVCYNLMINEHR